VTRGIVGAEHHILNPAAGYRYLNKYLADEANLFS
jgi:hypothetical protein